jgi:hypothetical protein
MMFSRELVGTVAALVVVAVATSATTAHASTIVVDKTNDAGLGSLRQAILDANARAGPDRIEFAIPGDPAVAQVIAPVNDLPAITGKVEIDGYTQTGSTPAESGVPAEVRVVIDATLTNRGLELATNGSLVRGLQVSDAALGFLAADGIVVTGNGNRFEGNLIGTDGTQDLGNDDAGIDITGDFNTVGGKTPAAGNVISGNLADGVRITGMGNRIAGNLIGTDETGAQDIGNTGDGIAITGTQNLVGASDPASRNIVSGNSSDGVSVVGADNHVTGNFIGTDVTGVLEVGNGDDGVEITGAGNSVGAAAEGEANLLSGNRTGVRIAASNGTGNRVQGNLVGTDVTGTQDLGNSSNGIDVVAGSSGTLIGGSQSGAGNVIGGNDAGISLGGNANSVLGNRIGTTLAGDTTLPNDIGIEISGGDGNTVGGEAAGQANVISGNEDGGIRIALDLAPNPVMNNPALNNRVEGNRIGTSLDGTIGLPNTGDGIEIIDSSFNTIGGRNPGAGNLIAGNQDDGVRVRQLQAGALAVGNLIVGNVIGLDSDGAALANGGDGINLLGANSNTIGGNEPGAGNVIAANDGDGIDLDDADTNSVVANRIGTSATGTLELGNGGSGVRIDGDLNRVGDENGDVSANTIAFNGEDGVTVEGGVGNRISHNRIRANYEIGIDLDADDVTDNDPLALDADSGANDLQNFPVLTAAFRRAEQTPGPNGLPVFTFTTGFTWTLDSEASRSFVIEFYANAACDASQPAEGEVFLGSTFTQTDGAGLAAGTATVAFAPPGQAVTATAMILAPGVGPGQIGLPSSNSHTSEFSTCEVIG